MDLPALFKPWLGVHIVVLLTPPMGLNVNTVNGWVNRDLIEHMADVHRGKNTFRRFSLASAVQIHAMHLAVTHGLSLPYALHVGNAAVERLMKINDYEDNSRAALHTNDSLLLSYGQKENQRHTYVGEILTPEELCRQTMQTGMPGQLSVAVLIEVDHLLEVIWSNYHDVSYELNEKALLGGLKPFPKSIQEGVALANEQTYGRARGYHR